MRIDSVIATIDSIPHTYQAFVIVSSLFALVLLNSSPTNPILASSNTDYQLKNLTDPVVKEKKSTSGFESEPQPKWHILKTLNVLAVIGLLASFGWFASNASTYLNDSNALLQFMAIWSAFLCYFFGFFGMSFIDADELERGGVAEEHPNTRDR